MFSSLIFNALGSPQSGSHKRYFTLTRLCLQRVPAMCLYYHMGHLMIQHKVTQT